MNENMTPKTQRLSSSQSECWRETHKNKKDWEMEGGKMARKQPACIHPSPCLFLRSVPLPFNISPSSRVGQDNISQLVRNATAQRASQQRAASLLGFRLSRFLLLWRITININTVVGSEWNWLCSEPLYPDTVQHLCLRWISQICSSTTQPGSVYIAVPFATSTNGAGF
ncbi:hypothetical protein I7I53_07090 [Histoplasma capsulatum var. duboisii H88]|nr:hypothetical protein I7I53_07090 [Histoplasma capsulatum var. duboisii H88]